MLPNGVYTHEHDAHAAEMQTRDMVVPTFYREKQLNKKKSVAAGRSIYDEYDAVKYFIPGDNTTEHKEKVTDEIINRFRSRWEAYLQGREQTNGMPLDAWYKLADYPGLIEEMRALRIRSVEDLANINDDVAGRTGWGYVWRDNAKAEIAARKSQEELSQNNKHLEDALAAEKAAREAVEKRMADLEARLAAAGGAVQPEESARKPGRPPKAG